MKILLLMLSLLTIELLALEARAQTPSRDALRKTVEHMRDLAREQQQALEAAEVDNLALIAKVGEAEASRDALAADKLRIEQEAKNLSAWGVDQQRLRIVAEKLAAEETRRADLEHRNAVQNAKERDVFVWLFAGVGAVAVTLAVGPYVTRAFGLNPLWALGAHAAIFLFSLGGFFGLVRIVLSQLVK